MNRNPERAVGGEGGRGQGASAWSGSGLVSAGAGGHRATVPGCRVRGGQALGCPRPPTEQKCAKHSERVCTRPTLSMHTDTGTAHTLSHAHTHTHPTAAGRMDGAWRSPCLSAWTPFFGEKGRLITMSLGQKDVSRPGGFALAAEAEAEAAAPASRWCPCAAGSELRCRGCLSPAVRSVGGPSPASAGC